MADHVVSDVSLSAVADAIRTKSGLSAPLAFPTAFVSALDAIETGGGMDSLLTATYVPTTRSIKSAVNSYPFVPKKQTELILWIVQPSNINTQGSVGAYLLALWLLNGSPGTTDRAYLIYGSQGSTPWMGEPFGAYRKSAADFELTEDGILHMKDSAGDWYYIGNGQTIKLYEIPINPAEA